MKRRKMVAGGLVVVALLIATVPAQAAGRYHSCRPVSRFDARASGKSGKNNVPCWMVADVERHQPRGRMDGYSWRETAHQSQRSGRWTYRFWRRGIDLRSPAVIIVTVPAR
jgi:hypothetical protein